MVQVFYLSGKGFWFTRFFFKNSEGLKKFFLKNATKKFALGNLSQKGLMTGIAGLSALPLYFKEMKKKSLTHTEDQILI